MKMDVYKVLEEKGIHITASPAPRGLYQSTVIPGPRLLYTSGTAPRLNGVNLYSGKVGEDVTVEQAQECARLCATNILGHLEKELGDLNRVVRVVKILGFIASGDDFYEQTEVLNGASRLFYDIFGEMGMGVRSAIGVRCLPQNIPVEVEAVFEICDEKGDRL